MASTSCWRAARSTSKGKVFRIGHLGFVCDRDVPTAVAAAAAAELAR
jgi:aspartate aminotransferase-like enzyme